MAQPNDTLIDLRSDTVTRPTEGMLSAMMQAQVGDDVFSEDPTVLQLEQKVADMFGMEAGIYCPSGTMTNQIAIKVHTNPLEEIICHRLAHIYNYEAGGIAFNSGLSIRLIEGNRGLITAEDVLANINHMDVHMPITSMVAVENTSNKGGGAFFMLDQYKELSKLCKEKGLKFHLDGARLFNALTESGDSPADYGQYFDTISICLSKGLGAPVGSVLVGDAVSIKKAKRVRKVFGGGMRQAGYLAAAGIYALDNHVTRMSEDHQRAKILGEALANSSFVEEVLPVDTNIVLFKLNDKYGDDTLIDKLLEHNITTVQMAHRMIRFVTHLDFTDDMLDEVVRVIGEL